MIKVIGDTGNGRCGCGCRVMKGETYFINSSHISQCKNHYKEKPRRVVKIPEDLVDGLIKI